MLLNIKLKLFFILLNITSFQFIDDDTPAPETSIPVPQIRWKGNNYFYQFVYIMYIISFLAYVYVRINYTLDAPGLNRIYCIVVAVLEIITAPSLIMQVNMILNYKIDEKIKKIIRN